MNALHAFLIFWNWFTTTHTCQTLASGNGGPVAEHVVYGGNCTQAVLYGQQLHSVVTWTGSTQGWINFHV